MGVPFNLADKNNYITEVLTKENLVFWYFFK